MRCVVESSCERTLFPRVGLSLLYWIYVPALRKPWVVDVFAFLKRTKDPFSPLQLIKKGCLEVIKLAKA